jgi:4-diphosphocytidyl-2-C-methyl-D-erythritol kinase
MAASGDASAPEDAVEYFSPSKVNLFLRVVRRRDDGYHDLASLFHVIDLGDDMKFAKSTGSRDTLVCSGRYHPARLKQPRHQSPGPVARQRPGSTQMFWVELVKNVPHGAGLGGGSGNAATAMWAANELCGR